MSAADQPNRLPSGGAIRRDRSISFTFEGKSYQGFEGDTLASALLANGVRVVGRSFKYHRPRGIIASGVEESNGLVELGRGDWTTPNLRVTEVDLHDRLQAKAVNCWPSADFDVGGINNLFSRFLNAGFYYKTFMWPDWHLYEGIIRRAAGLGKVVNRPDPARYESRYAHCDVLVVGAGPAGIAAAAAAAASGAEVMLIEQGERPGGRLLTDAARIDGQTGTDWVQTCLATVKASPGSHILDRTVAVGFFDHNAMTLVESFPPDASGDGWRDGPRYRLWQVRAKRIILATGAIERPIVFSGNDRPGVMLSGAVRDYIARYAVRPGRRAVVFTNNDDAYATALSLIEAGAEIAALVDSRRTGPQDLIASVTARGIPVHLGAVVQDTRGYKGLKAVQIAAADGSTRWVRADLLAMSGGFNPAVHLFSQSGGRLHYDAEQAHFRPGDASQAVECAGAGNGTFALSEALGEGHRAGVTAALALGLAVERAAPHAEHARKSHPIEPLWQVPGGRSKAFVDFQHDVSASDVALAHQEGFVSVEHLKRYTTLGMAADQGKTSNVNALAIMASLTGRPIEETGTTKFRFPFTPVALGAFRGLARGKLYRPLREMPGHACHVAEAAKFDDYGGWLRPAHYPRAGEAVQDSIRREALAVRTSVGLFEGSPLGKIAVKGPDAAKFLDLIYANTMSTLKPGRCRYGLMLDEQGVIIDDGVTARLAEDHFIVGTTGAGADRIALWLEEWLQCEWVDLDVVVSPITASWGVVTLSGPAARDILVGVGVDFPASGADFPHMSFREGHVAGIAARVYRVSYTGETSFEINVPASRVEDLWGIVASAGRERGITAIGIDAWDLLRTEKGFLHIGADTDGTTTPLDVGWDHVLRKKSDFVGRRSLLRVNDQRTDRLHFVGFEAVDGTASLPIGSHVAAMAGGSQGYVTSAGFSPVLNRWVALGMLQGGRARMGETVLFQTESGPVQAKVADPSAYDPTGERLNG